MTYRVTYQRYANRPAAIVVINADNAKSAKLAAKRMTRDANGFYPRITNVQEAQ